jgi:hypothetical protein
VPQAAKEGCSGTPFASRCFAGMIVFKVRAEPLDGDGPPASAFVVAKDADEAILLLRKDINFTDYRLPPVEMVACLVDADEVRIALGEDAAHEKGVYGFHLIGTETPPLQSN